MSRRKKGQAYICRVCGNSHQTLYLRDLCEQLCYKHLEKDEAEAKRISLQELKQYFATNYGYIALELSDVDLSKWMAQSYVCNLSLPKTADLLSDYILSQGLGDVME